MKSIQYQLKLVEENNGDCDSKQDKMEERIGFLAWVSKDLQNIPHHKDVIFDLVKTNQGNAYDPSTGIFTAPVDGLFSFSWTVLTQNNKYFETDLELNGQQMGRNYARATKDIHISASQSVVLYMKKNDKVVIKAHGTGQHMFNAGWSTFSGFLIN